MLIHILLCPIYSCPLRHFLSFPFHFSLHIFNPFRFFPISSFPILSHASHSVLCRPLSLRLVLDPLPPHPIHPFSPFLFLHIPATTSFPSPSLLASTHNHPRFSSISPSLDFLSFASPPFHHSTTHFSCHFYLPLSITISVQASIPYPFTVCLSLHFPL